MFKKTGAQYMSEVGICSMSIFNTTHGGSSSLSSFPILRIYNRDEGVTLDSEMRYQTRI
ncbi:hypothetical protein KSS87_012701 [Heliosperma pusillum]|nr:hypothetical protein KSS87_012701 [Heliosperma pusillum]